MWTEENVETLRKLWGEGVSSGVIASRLGTTRNAVCGKVDRLGLPARITKMARPNAGPPARGERRPVQPKPRADKRVNNPDDDRYAPPAPCPDARPVALLHAREDDCRWPEGDVGSDDFHFCGAPKERGQSYCPYHVGIAYRGVGAEITLKRGRLQRTRANMVAWSE